MLTHTYTDLPERFYQRTNPATFPDPELVVFNSDLADNLGLTFSSDIETAQILSGQRLLPGSEPIAQAYAGSQFGHFVPQLGDGRAHLLGEINGLDIQLKGSGRTRFSRGGDGRSPLGPAIREFLVSEAMHALGVPTSRSLGVVTTGEMVYRQDGPEPGAVLTRLADSHLRVGTFQYFRHRNDLQALELLCDYTVGRHYQEIACSKLADRCLELLRAVAQRQGDLVARWYAVGFIHGVMNTDNCSMAGVTIDYGPCAFMDEFHFTKVFSSIDQQGRYAYGNQMTVAAWNIQRLADCLLPLISDDPEVAASRISDALTDVFASFTESVYLAFARKLGLPELNSDVEELITDFLRYLESHSLDFTLSFANLGRLCEGDTKHYVVNSDLDAFLRRWKDQDPDLSQISAANPSLIPRNHQIEKVIDNANSGDYGHLTELWNALKNPYDVPGKYRHFTGPPRVEERVYQTFCGT